MVHCKKMLATFPSPVGMSWTFFLRCGALLPRPHSPLSTAGFRAQICEPFKELRNRFPASRAVTAILFEVPASQAT